MQRNRPPKVGREDHERKARNSELDFSEPGSSFDPRADLALSLYIPG